MIVEDLNGADLARYELAYPRMRFSDKEWQSTYPLEITHRKVKPGGWKAATAEALPLVQLGNVPAARRVLQRGGPFAGRQAIALAQPLPPMPADVMPFLGVIRDALTSIGQDETAREVSDRMDAEGVIDAAITNNDALAVKKAFSDGARPTTNRIVHILMQATRPGASLGVLQAMCGFVGAKRLAHQVDMHMSRAIPARARMQSPRNAIGFAFQSLPDTSALMMLLKAGFRPHMSQVPTFYFIADQEPVNWLRTPPSQPFVAHAMVAACTAPNLELSDRLARLTKLKEWGADFNAMIPLKRGPLLLRLRQNLMTPVPGAGPVIKDFFAPPDVVAPPFLHALFLQEPVVPILQHLQSLGADLTLKARDNLNAWHGLALEVLSKVVDLPEIQATFCCSCLTAIPSTNLSPLRTASMSFAPRILFQRNCAISSNL